MVPGRRVGTWWVMAAMLTIGVSTSLIACGAEEPPPPSAPIDAACPAYRDLDVWGADHPEGSLPADLKVEQFLRCLGTSEDEYRQLETDQTRSILEALKLPSHPTRSGCPMDGRQPIVLIAVGSRSAFRAFVPRQGCDYHPDAERVIDQAPWRESAHQPSR